MVFIKAGIRVADRANEPCQQVLPPAHVIDYLIVDLARLQRIEEQSVDGKVASFGIFLGGGETHAGGMPTIDIFRIGTKRGDFNHAAVVSHEDDAERRPDRLGIGKQRSHAIGRSIGGHIPILGLASEEQIVHASAGKVRHMPCRAVLKDGPCVPGIAARLRRSGDSKSQDCSRPRATFARKFTRRRGMGDRRGGETERRKDRGTEGQRDGETERWRKGRSALRVDDRGGSAVAWAARPCLPFGVKGLTIVNLTTNKKTWPGRPCHGISAADI